METKNKNTRIFCQPIIALALVLLPLTSGRLCAQTIWQTIIDSAGTRDKVNVKLPIGREDLPEIERMMNNTKAREVNLYVVVEGDTSLIETGGLIWQETVEQQEITIGEQANTIRELAKTIREQNQTIIEIETLMHILYDSLEILGNLGRGQSITILGQNDTIEKHVHTIDTLNQTVATLLQILLQKDDTIKMLEYAADPNNWDSTLPCGLRAGKVVVVYDTIFLVCDTAQILADFTDTSRHRRNITIEVKVFRLEIAWDSNISGWQFQFPRPNPDPGHEKQPRDSLGREKEKPGKKRRITIFLEHLGREKNAKDKNYFAISAGCNAANQALVVDGKFNRHHPQKALVLPGMGMYWNVYWNRNLYIQTGLGGMVNGNRHIVLADKTNPNLITKKKYTPLMNQFYATRLELSARWKFSDLKKVQPSLSLGTYHSYLLRSHLYHDMDPASFAYPFLFEKLDVKDRDGKFDDSRFANSIRPYTWGMLLGYEIEFRKKCFVGAKCSAGLRSATSHKSLRLYDTSVSLYFGGNINHPDNKHRKKH